MLPFGNEIRLDSLPIRPVGKWRLIPRGASRHGLGSYLTTFIAATAAWVLYGPVLVGLASQWVTDTTTSHGILLAGAAAIVSYRRLPRLRALPVAPHNAGAAVFALALIIYTIGALTGDVFVLRVSFPIAIAGAILFIWGDTHLRVALAPLALLCLAIPLPSVIVTYLTLPLQLIASQVATAVLELLRIPVVRHGNVLELRNITLEVAEACSGLQSLQSLVAVAAVSAALLSLSVRRTMLLVAAAIPIAVFGNGLRVAATGILATWIGDVAVRGFLHDLTGYVAFMAMCAAILALHLATRARRTVAVN